MAKNKHTFAKRQRELKKMQKAADKRERRAQRKAQTSTDPDAPERETDDILAASEAERPDNPEA